MTAVPAPALRVLVADDEAMGRDRLRRLLGRVPHAELVGECRSGQEVLDALSNATADVLLLDIRMPGMSGFDVARAITKMPDVPLVIFVTAFGEHALDAFELHAIDYLLNPSSRSDSSPRWNARASASRPPTPPSATSACSRFFVTR
jgi:DNA-binding LytR/AlgR family response regulator